MKKFEDIVVLFIHIIFPIISVFNFAIKSHYIITFSAKRNRKYVTKIHTLIPRYQKNTF